MKWAETIQAAIDIADLIWISTPPLAKVYDLYDRLFFVIPNGIDPALLPAAPAKMTKTAGWRGTSTALADSTDQYDWFEANKAVPDSWLFIAQEPHLNLRGLKYSFEDQIPPEIYLLYIQQLGINALWKPLQDCPFNDAKSNIAWIEATLMGGVCVTNYADKPGWDQCFSEFYDFDEPMYNYAWSISRETIADQYNIKTINRLRAESLKHL
jgi:hypothetical protein